MSIYMGTRYFCEAVPTHKKIGTSVFGGKSLKSTDILQTDVCSCQLASLELFAAI